MEHSIAVMVIDDHPTILWGLEQLINSATPKMRVVAAATNYDDAIKKLGGVSPDVIVLDMDLSGQYATDLLPLLKAVTPARIIVFTGLTEQTLLDQAVRRGARGVLHKRANGDQILKAIEKVHRGELWLDQDTISRMLGGFLHPSTPTIADPELEKQASLTAKERKVIEMIVQESSTPNKKLAQQLLISEYTLRNHLTSIYQKLGLSNRLDLYVYATKFGLGKPS
jgi:DNA-binding NarL/FixJ family response regulator